MIVSPYTAQHLTPDCCMIVSPYTAQHLTPD